MAYMAEGKDEESGDNGEANIFSNEGISSYPLAKGNRCVPDWITSEFVTWLDLAHPEILSCRGLSPGRLAALVEEFEYTYNLSYKYEIVEWKLTLDQL